MTQADITVSLYQSLWPMIKENDRVMLACELNDLYVEELDDMSVDEADKILLTTDILYQQLPKLPIKELSLDGHTFSLCEFGAMEFGAFIDLEFYISNDHILNLHRILAIIYRLPVPRGPLEAYKIEAYDNYTEVRSQLFLPRPMIEVYGAVYAYVQYREALLRRYKGLFSQPDDDVEEEQPVKKMTSEEVKQMEKEKRIRKWSYELLLFRLTKGDPLKLKEAAGLSITEAFNLLAMMEELQIQ